MSVLGDSSASAGHSASVTTGQGSDGLGNWMALGVSSQIGNNRLGRSRPPTCNIPTARGNDFMVPIITENNRADTMTCDQLGFPQPAKISVGPGLHVVSGSTESTQDNTQAGLTEQGVVSEEAEEGSQQDASEISEEDAEVELDLRGLGLPKAAYKRGHKAKEKKKVGRPIAYRGDPNAPELTDQERRRIKRRIANRESARRVRHKRQEELEDMQIKMEQIQAHNSHLQQHAARTKEQKDMLSNQLLAMEDKYEKSSVENKRLAIEIQALRQSLQLKMSALEHELDKRANEAEKPMCPSTAFAHPAVQSQPLSPFSMAQQAGMGSLAMDTKLCPSAHLDWLPSLNMDDVPGLDGGHLFQ